MERLSKNPGGIESVGKGLLMWKKANLGTIESLYESNKSFRLPSENARRAFNKEVLPFLEDMEIFSVVALDDLYEYFKNVAFPKAFSGQNNPTYNRLIHHKSLDLTDDQFYGDLQFVLEKWYERFRDRLEQRHVYPR